MNTQELFLTLESHLDKNLLFEYSTNKFVGANYHITEVKHIIVDSVDCGAQTDSWNETVIQLWESPMETHKTEYMLVAKALEILKLVGTKKSYDMKALVKFEYSNASFHTAQLFVNDFSIKNGNLIFQLGIEKTDCKAKELCGVPEDSVQSLEKSNVTVDACCSPESGCC